MTTEPAGLDPQNLLQHTNFLRNLARFLVRDEALAEDLVQQAWLQALTRPPRHPGAIRSWLARVTRSLVANESRSASRRSRREQLAATARSAPSPLEVTLLQEKLAAIAAAVRTLPEPLRMVIHCRYYQELGPKEIARHLDTPLATVKSRLLRAQALLRQRLDKEFGGGRREWLQALAPLAGLPLGQAKAAVPAGIATTGGLLAMSTKPLLTLSAVTLACLVGICWLILDLVQPAVEPLPEASPPLVGAAVPPGSAGMDPDSPAPVASVRKPMAAATAGDPVGSEPGPIEPSPPNGVQIRILDGEKGTPVAGALVYYLDGGRKGQRSNPMHPLHGKSPLAAYLQRGRRFRTDAKGLVRVPPPEMGELFSSASVAANRGDRWGRMSFGAGLEELDLTITREKRLQVLVQDGAGKPVGAVPVALGFNERGAFHLLDRATTAGSTGVATFRLLAWHLQATPRGYRPDLVRFAFPAAGEAELRFDIDRLPDHPLRLTLPTLGRVEIAVTGPDGAVPDRSCRVQLLSAAEGHPTFPVLSEMLTLADVVGGRAIFPRVALGLSLRARLWDRPSGVGFIVDPASPLVDLGPGPSRRGQVVKARLPLARPPQEIRGTLVDSAGRPVVSGKYEISIIKEAPAGIEARSWSGRASFTVDGQGQFRTCLAKGVTWSGKGRATISGDLSDALARNRWRGRVEEWSRLEGGAIHLGRVVLRERPLLLAGRVEDGAGAPIAGARLKFWPPGTRGSKGELKGMATRTDGRGRFRVWGDHPGESFRVKVYASHFQGGPGRVVTRGADDLRLTMVRGGGLIGSLRHPPGFNPFLLRGRLVRQDRPGCGDAAGRDIHPFTRDGSTLVQALNLEPGRWTLSLRLMYEEEPFLTIPGLVIPRAGLGRDPRIQRLDLAKHLRFIGLHIHGPDGRRLSAKEVGRIRLELVEAKRKLTLSSSETPRVATSRPFLDCRLYAPGCRLTPIRLVRPELRIDLPAGLPVEISTTPPLALPQKFRLVFRLQPGDSGQSGAWTGAGPVTMRVGAPGRYRLTARLIGTSLFSSRPVEVKPEQVEVTAGGETTRITATLDPTSLDRALEELTRKP